MIIPGGISVDVGWDIDKASMRPSGISIGHGRILMRHGKISIRHG